jgi:hypothetical protein
MEDAMTPNQALLDAARAARAEVERIERLCIVAGAIDIPPEARSAWFLSDVRDKIKSHEGYIEGYQTEIEAHKEWTERSLREMEKCIEESRREIDHLQWAERQYEDDIRAARETRPTPWVISLPANVRIADVRVLQGPHAYALELKPRRPAWRDAAP